MHKFLSFFILISSALILFASIALFLQKSINLRNNPVPKRTPLTNKNGELIFSNGTCKKDSDCAPAGCSSQICSNDKEVVTTCEYSKSFPTEGEYACGCVKSSCAWYTK